MPQKVFVPGSAMMFSTYFPVQLFGIGILGWDRCACHALTIKHGVS
jgi:hypothetical protein